MQRSFLRLLALLAAVAFTAAACADNPAGTRPRPDADAKIGFVVSLAGMSVDLLVVEVTAADIATPLAFNVPVSNGTATGSLSVPPGAARTITVRAYDAAGTQTHAGSATVDVRPGQNVNVPITLVPRAGHVPISINIGSIVVGITRVGGVPAGGDRAGDTVRLQATVARPDGTPVAGARVSWATLDPAVARVDSAGVVIARGIGSTQIVATYGGFGAAVTLSFAAEDTVAGPDVTPPTLITFAVSPDTVNMAGGSTADVTFSATAEDVTAFYGMYVLLRSPDGQTTRDCYYSSNPQPGRSTRSCTVTLSRYGPGGRWTVDSLSISDNRGNVAAFTAAALAAAGHDNGVTVLNTSVDTTAPLLQGAAFTPDSLAAGSGYSQATLRITASDAQAGVETVEASGGNDAGTYFFSWDGSGLVDAGGDAWEGYLSVDGQYPPAGTLRLDWVRITDRAGNVTVLDAQQLDALGMRATLRITR